MKKSHFKTEKINVLHILPSLGIGGIEKLFINMAEHWSADKYAISACLLHQHKILYEKELTKNNIKYYIFGSKQRGRFDLMAIYKLFTFLKKNNINILHLHNISSQLYGTLAGMMQKIPIVIYHQHKTPTLLQRKVRFLNQLFRQPDVIIAVSNNVKTALIKELKIQANKIKVIYNGIKNYPLEPNYSYSTDIFTVGRLSPEKGIQHLISAMSQIKNKIKALRLFIIGDGIMRQELEKQVFSAGLQDKVFFKGFLSEPEKTFNQYGIFVLPSLEEGFGLSLLEAMSSGKPVIASKVGGIPEIINDGIDGILVPPGDAGALADAILQLSSDDSLYKQLVTRGISRAKEFNIKKTVNEIENIYQELVHQKMNLTYDESTQRWQRT